MEFFGSVTLPSAVDLFRMLPFPDSQSQNVGIRACEAIPDVIEMLLSKTLENASKEQIEYIFAYVGKLATDEGNEEGSFLPVAGYMASGYMCFSRWLNGSNGPASGVAHFMGLLAEIIKRSASNQCPPKRLILPLHCMGKMGDVTTLALEIKSPEKEWRDQDTDGVSESAEEPLTVEAFYNILGCATITPNENMLYNILFQTLFITDSSKIHGAQYNRRYSWGMIVSGTVVIVRVTGTIIKGTSHVMDLATACGRRDFIEFVVRWSYCDLQHLGFDPTMVYLEDFRCWEITVHDEDENGDVCPQVVYGYNDFAIHKRVTPHSIIWNMVGRSTKPALLPDGTVPKYKPKENDIVIKNSWEDPEKPCDEIRTLRTITTAVLASKKKMKKSKGMYPELVAGGPVLIDGQEDTVQNIVGKQQWQRHVAKPSRVHRRMVTKGIGQPLSESRCSKQEKALVKRDAKLVNKQISKFCGIIHKNPGKPGNLLVRRNSKDGSVKGGMLINFDEIAFIKK